ncbi:MAG: methyltransferase domain-containing protein [Anaerolineaceae bacterium]
MAGDKPVQRVMRVLRTKEEARRSYDRLSRWYDLFSGTGEFKLALETLDLMNLPVGGTILEVGFGTGRILLELTRRVGEHGQVYGVDLSQGMCRITRRRLEKAGELTRVLLTAGDGYRLPIAPGSVDGIFMGFTLELFDTPELLPVVQECLRILKPGGQLGIVTLSVSNRSGFAERLYKLAHTRWPRLVDCRPIDPVSLLAKAGIFYETLIFKKMWGLSVAQLVLVKDG